MVQPLADKVSPLRLCSFGSDNKFTSDDVKRRLHFIDNELKKAGIDVLTCDEDLREFKMMRQKLELGVHHNQSAGNFCYAYVVVNLVMLISCTLRCIRKAYSLFEISMVVVRFGYRQKFYPSSRQYT